MTERLAKFSGLLHIRHSVQLTFISIFCVFLVVALGLLNIFPTTVSRQIVFNAKQSALLNQASIFSASLAALELLGVDGVEQVMELVDVNEFDRVIVTDSAGVTLYDTNQRESMLGAVCDFSQAVRALGGEVVFSCYYDGDTFFSRAAMPVVSYDAVIGAVYLYDEDEEQAALINSIQSQIRSISLVAGALTMLAVVCLTHGLTRRLRELVDAMRIVREGNYDYRVAVRGGDEVADLSAAFNDMTQRLQSTDELRRRFVSDASHELRTPLASIRLLSDSVVQSENMDVATMREFVTDIGSEAERLQRLTEKLMRLTRMDAGAVTAEKTDVDLKKVAERTVHLLEPLAQQKDVTIYTELESGVVIRAVEDDIYQIIFNLAENAIKYNNFGGNVFLRLFRGTDGAVLTVEDTGIGIPEADLPYIFTRFYRVDKTRSRQFGGSGLGLSIVHDTVRQNGGTVTVARRETTGTRFTVTFPRQMEAGAAVQKGENEP